MQLEKETVTSFEDTDVGDSQTLARIKIRWGLHKHQQHFGFAFVRDLRMLVVGPGGTIWDRRPLGSGLQSLLSFTESSSERAFA